MTAGAGSTPGRGDLTLRGRRILRKEHGRFMSLALEERPKSRRGGAPARRAGRLRVEVRAPRRVIRRAVDRNRLRRQVREALRAFGPKAWPEGCVLVVSARPAAVGAETRAIWEELGRLVKRTGL